MNEFETEQSRKKKLDLGFRATIVDILCQNARMALAENIAACETGDDIVDVRLGSEGAVLVFASGSSIDIALRYLTVRGFTIEKNTDENSLFMPWSPAERQAGTPQAAPSGGAGQTDLSATNDLGALWLSRSAARNRRATGTQ